MHIQPAHISNAEKRNYFPSRRRVKHTSRPVAVTSTAKCIIAIQNILHYMAGVVFFCICARIVGQSAHHTSSVYLYLHFAEANMYAGLADCGYGRINFIFSHSLHEKCHRNTKAIFCLGFRCTKNAITCLTNGCFLTAPCAGILERNDFRSHTHAFPSFALHSMLYGCLACDSSLLIGERVLTDTIHPLSNKTAHVRGAY